jgi:hypothetical protein
MIQSKFKTQHYGTWSSWNPKPSTLEHDPVEIQNPALWNMIQLKFKTQHFGTWSNWNSKPSTLEHDPVEIQNPALWNIIQLKLKTQHFGTWSNWNSKPSTSEHDRLQPDRLATRVISQHCFSATFVPWCSHSRKENSARYKMLSSKFLNLPKTEIVELEIASSERVCSWWHNQGLQEVAYKHSWCSYPLKQFSNRSGWAMLCCQM